MTLTAEEQKAIREVIINNRPEEYGLPGSLWTLKKICSYIKKEYGKTISQRGALNYMRR